MDQLLPKGGSTGALTTAETKITIPANARGVDIHTDADSRVFISSATANVAVADSHYGYMRAGLNYRFTFPSGKFTTIHLSALATSCYYITFLG